MALELWCISGRNQEASPIQCAAVDSGFFSFHLEAHGHLGELLIVPAGGSRMPFSEQVLSDHSHFVKMKGKEIFKVAIRAMTACAESVLSASKN